MEVITNVLANPMSGVIVFAVLWTLYYVEKNYLAQNYVTTTRAVNMNPIKAVQEVKEEVVTEEVTNRELVLEEA